MSSLVFQFNILVIAQAKGKGAAGNGEWHSPPMTLI
jgi:hypothetical protein